MDCADIVTTETIEIVDIDTGLLNSSQAVAYEEGEGCEASANHLFVHSQKDNIQSFVQSRVRQSDPGCLSRYLAEHRCGRGQKGA